jgi:hypothetical protein
MQTEKPLSLPWQQMTVTSFVQDSHVHVMKAGVVRLNLNRKLPLVSVGAKKAKY